MRPTSGRRKGSWGRTRPGWPASIWNSLRCCSGSGGILKRRMSTFWRLSRSSLSAKPPGIGLMVWSRQGKVILTGPRICSHVMPRLMRPPPWGWPRVLLRQGQRSEAGRRYLQVARATPGSVIGVWSVHRLSELLGRRFSVTELATPLEKLADSIPWVFDRIADDAVLWPSPCKSARAKPFTIPTNR